MTLPPPRPWWREPWPAFASADGLVADDYYKQGLSINRRLAREDAARSAGITALVSREGDVLRVRLSGAAPEALFVHLAHATRAGHDQRLRLAAAGAGIYEASLPPLAAGRWRIAIEDPRGSWRITKEGLEAGPKEERS
jgi:hypothetical protein